MPADLLWPFSGVNLACRWVSPISFLVTLSVGGHAKSPPGIYPGRNSACFQPPLTSEVIHTTVPTRGRPSTKLTRDYCLCIAPRSRTHARGRLDTIAVSDARQRTTWSYGTMLSVFGSPSGPTVIYFGALPSQPVPAPSLFGAHLRTSGEICGTHLQRHHGNNHPRRTRRPAPLLWPPQPPRKFTLPAAPGT